MTAQRVALWLATIGGVGNIPFASGTWGSAVGVPLGLLTAWLVPWPWSLMLYGMAFGFCAWSCTQAARSLGQSDPSAVILDEVWAMALIIAALPRLCVSWPLLGSAFLLFRAFDIVKPPPLRQLERLPEGWGIMADDLGAALYTIGTLWIVIVLFRW